MATSTELTNITTRTGATSRAPIGRRVPAIVSPLDSNATIGAGETNRYIVSSTARSDHGEGSAAADGVEAALQNNSQVWAVAADEDSDSPFTSFFSSTQDSLPDSDLPIWEETPTSPSSTTAVGKDSQGATTETTLTVQYTVDDPSTQTPDSDTVLINTDTGDFNADTTHTGVEISWKKLDTLGPLGNLLEHPFELVTIPDEPLNAATFGRYKEILNEVTVNRHKRLVTAVLESGADPSADSPSGDTTKDISDALNPEPNLCVLAAHYSGDLSSAWCAYRASIGIMGTTKEALAPEGVTIDQGYSYSDFGADQSSDADTFHNQGFNAVFRDLQNNFRISNDRAVTGLGTFDTFFSNTRGKVAVERQIQEGIKAARRESPEAIPISDAGIQALKGVIEQEIGNLQRQNVVGTSPGDVQVNEPRLSDVSDADRVDRVLDFFQVTVRILPQVHVTNIDLDIDL
jgi:hypothetical protein